MSSSQAYPCGWYESRPGQEQYWNGSVWTGDYRPVPTAQGARGAVSLQFVMTGAPNDAIRAWQLERTDWFASGGFNLAGQSENVLTYSHRYMPGWAIIVAIFLFPIGLLAAFFARDTDTLAARFDPYDRDTMVTLTGIVMERQRHALIVGLEAEYNDRAWAARTQEQPPTDVPAEASHAS